MDITYSYYFSLLTYLSCTNSFQQKHLPESFSKKVVLKSLAKFTGKRLCRSLFLNEVAGLQWLLQFQAKMLLLYPLKMLENLVF